MSNQQLQQHRPRLQHRQFNDRTEVDNAKTGTNLEEDVVEVGVNNLVKYSFSS